MAYFLLRQQFYTFRTWGKPRACVTCVLGCRRGNLGSHLYWQYAGIYLVQLGYKVFAYSVKLHCEIAILNKLVEFATRTRRLDSLNPDFQLSTMLQREWDSTLERAFGECVQQDENVGLGAAQVGAITEQAAGPSETVEEKCVKTSTGAAA